MIQWEYLFVTCDYHNGDWHPRYINGEEVRESRAWQDVTLYDFSNLLGEKGWELVDFLTDHNRLGSPEAFRLVFKRPKHVSHT